MRETWENFNADALTGDETDNLLFGDATHSQLQGLGGNDRLVGGSLPNPMWGGDGEDDLYGNQGEDEIRGGAGSDRIYGGKDNDRLFGEAGDDWLAGDRGEDELTGGEGSDRFVLARGYGGDRITDFQLGEDRLQLLGDLTFDDLEIADDPFGRGAIVRDRLTGEVLATLDNIQAAQLVSSSVQTQTPTLEASQLPHRLQDAIARAANLDNYTAKELAATREWLVGLNAQTTPDDLAARFNASNLGGNDFIAGTYTLEFPKTLEPETILQQLQQREGVLFAYPLVPQQAETRFVPDDVNFSRQWHLDNRGQSGGTPGEDARVTTPWDSVRGRGVTVAVVDDGVEGSHPDLRPNFRRDLSFDFNDNDFDPTPPAWNPHGTAVAGVAIARGDNGIGVSGAAPNADLAGLRLIGAPTSDRDEARALSYQNTRIDIYNNSWGPLDGRDWLGEPGPLTLAALENSIANGRDGLGNIYIWAGGNGRRSNDNVNYDGYANSRYTIAVGAIDHNGVQSWYSEPGASLLISAHSDGGPGSGIVTTDLTGASGYNGLGDTSYTNSFGGTSSASPLAAGVVALMLEANPGLNWRDVQHILVETARQNDRLDGDWVRNGAGYLVNHKYGFGAIDAEAAVTEARTWTSVGPEVSVSSAEVRVDRPIPDGTPTGIADSVNITDDLQVEWAEVVFDADHRDRGNLEVKLVSPDGTESILAQPHGDNGDNYDRWVFTSARHWGEASRGEWTLEVSDPVAGTVGTWNGWELRLYGTHPGTHGVSVSVDRVKGDFDPGRRIEGLRRGASDFFTHISIDGQVWESETKRGSNDYEPEDWQSQRFFNGNLVPISLKLYDRDRGIFNDNDRIDINPDEDEKNLYLIYHAETEEVLDGITLDVIGRSGEQIYRRGNGDGEIWFTINGLGGDREESLLELDPAIEDLIEIDPVEFTFDPQPLPLPPFNPPSPIPNPVLEPSVSFNKPDLAIASFNLGEPLETEDRFSIPVAVAVKNKGFADAEIFKLATSVSLADSEETFIVPFTADDTDLVNPDLGVYPFSEASLAAGENLAFSGSVFVPKALAGTSIFGEDIRLQVEADSTAGEEFADSNGRIEEMSEDNNTASQDIHLGDGEPQPPPVANPVPISSQADLLVSSIEVLGTATETGNGLQLPVEVDIANWGNLAAQPFKISASYRDPNSGQTFLAAFSAEDSDGVSGADTAYPWTTDDLEVGETVTVRGMLYFATTTLQNRDVEVTITADSVAGEELMEDTGRIAESDETNNTLEETVSLDVSEPEPEPDPNLTVTLTAVTATQAGETIPSFEVRVTNTGDGLARGTNSGNGGYMVDLSLSSDRNIPEGFASFSPNFSEDVLLRGGRISNTPDLEPGESITFTEDNLELPDDVPAGDYFLTARVDPGENVAESDETDNTDLVDLEVLA